MIKLALFVLVAIVWAISTVLRALTGDWMLAAVSATIVALYAHLSVGALQDLREAEEE